MDSSLLLLLVRVFLRRHFLSIFPLAFLYFAILGRVRAFAVHFATLPFADVHSTGWPFERAHALLLVILVLSFVPPTVGPREHAIAVHFVVEP